MSTRKQQLRQEAKQRSTKNFATGDSFQNFAARTGYGAGSMQDASHYGFDFKSRNRVEMEAVYRSSWIAGQVIDVYAQDMTKSGIEIHSGMPPDQIEKLQKALIRRDVWKGLSDTIQWARLYGGAIAVILIDGQDTATPLNVQTIAKGQFKGLLPLDRWVAYPSLGDLVTEYGHDFGKPKFYDVTSDAMALKGMRIHHSRVIRMDGVELPYWQRIAENGWGQSVLERLWDRLIAFDSATQGAAQLIYKAHLRTIRVDKLREIIATGGAVMEALAKQFDMIRQYQSNEGLTLLDKDDEFQTSTYTFSGLSDMMLQFGQQLSGATGIPLVRLFGQSPAGLNSSGDSDIRTYYDNIDQQRERCLRYGVTKLLDIMCRSELGIEPDDSLDFEFMPLWQMSSEQKATVAKSTTESIVSAFEAQIVDRHTALKELRQSSQITGVWSNITDEDIKDAENDPPPMPAFGAENENEGQAATPAEPGQAQPD